MPDRDTMEIVYHPTGCVSFEADEVRMLATLSAACVDPVLRGASSSTGFLVAWGRVPAVCYVSSRTAYIALSILEQSPGDVDARKRSALTTRMASILRQLSSYAHSTSVAIKP